MPGRPRDPDLESRLLTATWAILSEEGYAALTLAQVAARAGAHRSDVYRRWPTKVRLVADTLAVHLPPVSEVDTGSLLSDLRSYVDDLARSWSAPWMDGLVGWLADLADDTDAEAAFQDMGLRRGDALWTSLERAVERGELTQVPDGDLVSGLLEGPLMHARLVRRGPLTGDFLDAVADAAYHILMAPAASR
ncbi:TetR family transcriptional regulator [Nocardioides sp. J9]|uniref:TetR/AcrR family transcriptional regulator n=1 Tax=Nocardioides sp. J9 TaxID=935844 RepID=UPI0011A54CC6|nr:TetR/AcrR family transcriptional regulator [Nocardioides sp. J9]TWG99015.1 TetR family transcriptional regulator [Nocardioides sp. J9]